MLGAAITAWVLFCVLLEYRALAHSRRIRPRPVPAREADLALVTVVVPVAGDAASLRRTLPVNLLIPHTTFLLVPAAAAPDGSVAEARRLASHDPARVRVHVGTSGSKAGDLNAAWSLVETPYVLLLDADETTDARAVACALGILASDPEVGVVQGRKAPRVPLSSSLERFVAAERAHATLVDQRLHAERLGSGHFAGSAALLRWEVPVWVGGWSEDVLTEDIDLTLRIHLESAWRIRYEPSLLVREALPADLRAPVAQRTRWSRGWMQCTVRYLPRVVRERRRLGRKRAFGIAWSLVAAVSAPWATLVPAFVLLRYLGEAWLLPVAASLAVAAVALPARCIGYVHAARIDPDTPRTFHVGHALLVTARAYLWLVFGWVIQLSSMALDLVGAPRAWVVTTKHERRIQEVPKMSEIPIPVVEPQDRFKRIEAELASLRVEMSEGDALRAEIARLRHENAEIARRLGAIARLATGADR